MEAGFAVPGGRRFLQREVYAETGHLALEFDVIEAFLFRLVLVFKRLHLHRVDLVKPSNTVLDNLSDRDHLSHCVAHRRKGHILDLELLELFKDVAYIRLDLGACINSHNIIGNLFAFNGGLDNLLVLLHDDLI